MTRLLCAFLAFVFALSAYGSADAQSARIRLRLHAAPVVVALLNGNLVTEEFTPIAASAQIAASPVFVESLWFRCAPGSTTLSPDSYQGCFGAVIGNYSNATCGGASNAETTPGLNIVLNDTNPGNGLVRVNINNSTCGTNNSALGAFSPAVTLSTTWHHLLVYGDMTCTSSASHRCGGAYLDGVQVIAGFADQGTWSTSQTVNFDTNPFYVDAFATSAPSQASRRFEIAQLYLDTTASPVVAGTNTPNFSVSAFYNAGPVDFGATCSNPLGHTPTAFCLSNGPATFLTNNSSAGGKATFTATGQVANTVTNQAYAACFSPGETPDRPFCRWDNGANFHVQCAESTQTCSSTSQPLASNTGNAIVTGDLLCLHVATTANNASYNDNFQPPTGGGVTTWTNVLGTNVTATNAHFNNAALFCGTVTTPTAAGANLPTLTWTWLSNLGGGWVESSVTLIDFGGPITPSIAAFASTDSTISATTLPCQITTGPTAPAGKSLWVCAHMTYDWSNASPSSGIGPPSTSTLIGKLPAGTAGNRAMVEWEKINAAGAVTRTAQGNPGNKSIGISWILNGLFLLPARRRRRAENDNDRMRVAA